MEPGPGHWECSLHHWTIRKVAGLYFLMSPARLCRHLCFSGFRLRKEKVPTWMPSFSPPLSLSPAPLSSQPPSGSSSCPGPCSTPQREEVLLPVSSCFLQRQVSQALQDIRGGSPFSRKPWLWGGDKPFRLQGWQSGGWVGPLLAVSRQPQRLWFPDWFPKQQVCLTKAGLYYQYFFSLETTNSSLLWGKDTFPAHFPDETITPEWHAKMYLLLPRP